MKREPKTTKTKSSKIIIKPEDYFPPKTVEQKQISALEKIEEQTERNTEFKERQELRETELHTQVTELSKQGSKEYTEYMRLMKQKLLLEREASENYKKLSELVLKQAQEEYSDFQRKREKNIRELRKQGITVSKNSIFDTIREEALRKVKKDDGKES